MILNVRPASGLTPATLLSGPYEPEQRIEVPTMDGTTPMGHFECGSSTFLLQTDVVASHWRVGISRPWLERRAGTHEVVALLLSQAKWITSDITGIVFYGEGALKVDGKELAIIPGHKTVAVSQVEILATRENATIVRHPDGKLSWTSLVRQGESGIARIPGSGVKYLSAPFEPTALIPAATSTSADRTSYYWHPVKAKIYKLNNTVALPGAVSGRSAPLTGGGTVQEVRFFNMAEGKTVTETVLIGGSVPEDHEALTPSVRRRVLTLVGDDVKLTTAHLVNPGCLVLHDAVRFEFMGEWCGLRVSEDYTTAVLAKRFVRGWRAAMRTCPGMIPVTKMSDYFYAMAGPYDAPPDVSGSQDVTMYHSADNKWFRGMRLFSNGNSFKDREGTHYLVSEMVGYSLSSFNFAFIQAAYTLSRCGLHDPRSAGRIDVAPSLLAEWATRFAVSGDTTDAINRARLEGSDYIWHESLGTMPGEIVASGDDHSHRLYVPPHEMNQIRPCTVCGTRVHYPRIRGRRLELDGRTTENAYVCGQCCEEHELFVCGDCNTAYASSEASEDLDDVCVHCFEDHYDSCSRCGVVVHHVNLDGGRCSHCNNSSNSLLPYNHRPRLTFHKIASEPLFFGCEIELEYRDENANPRMIAQAANAVTLDYPACKNFMFAKHDGSLTRGAEFVTHPFSWEWFKANKAKLEDIFNQLGDDFEAKRSCGLHIHVSRDPHNRLEEFRLLQLIYENPKDWLAISRRVTTNYCKFETDAVRLRERVRVAKERSTFQDRYVALNPTNRKTLEWRMFAGTGNFEKFASAVALVAGTHAFVRSGATGVKPKVAKLKEFIASSEFAEYAMSRFATVA